MRKFAFLLLFTAAVTFAQMPASRKSKSDAEKVASAGRSEVCYPKRNRDRLPNFARRGVPRSAGRQQRMDLSSGLCRSCPR